MYTATAILLQKLTYENLERKQRILLFSKISSILDVGVGSEYGPG